MAILEGLSKHERSNHIHNKASLGSARLTIVVNVAVATGPALLGSPQSFVLNFFNIICKGGYYI